MGQVDVARALIARGADATAPNRDWWSSLQLALQMGQVDVARMIIERGADVTTQNNYGETPLHLASAQSLLAWVSPQKCTEVVHMLLEHGADVNARNIFGSTPFDLAFQSGLAEIIDVCQRGADSSAQCTTRSL